MNPFLQIPVLANIKSIGVNTPKDIAAGSPESSGKGVFAAVLDGTMASKGKLFENMQQSKGEKNALAEALMNNPLGLGVDPELLAALNINMDDGIIMTDEIVVDAASANVKTDVEQLPAAISGRISILGQLNIPSDSAIDIEALAYKLDVAGNENEMTMTEASIDSKSNIVESGRNEFAIRNMMLNQGKINDTIILSKTNDVEDSAIDNNIAKVDTGDNPLKDPRGISFVSTNNANLFSNDKLSMIDSTVADDILRQVEDKLNISRIEISREVPKVKADSLGETEVASILPKSIGDPTQENVTEEIVDEDGEQSTSKAAHAKADAGNKTLSAVVSDKTGNLNAKAEISNNSVELTTMKGIDTESISQDSARLKTSTTAEQSATVKFVLPEDLSGKNIQSKHTIFIKLEPESLGTVRLTLSSQGDSIMGRMVVDSTTARNAVESHINNLLENLAEKGVQLDAFQVSVGGGQTGRRYMQDNYSTSANRQYGWSREMEKYENELQGITTASRGNQYIGRLGVNWLA
ncbi:MAG: flagellar hook-length control protein FliK [Candidatus Zixiibacteriota bacterium]